MLNYVTKRIKRCYSVGISDLVAKKDFIFFKAEVDKPDVTKLVNAPTSFKNLKARVHDLHAGKLKSVPIDLKNSVMLYLRKLLKHKIQHTKDKSK